MLGYKGKVVNADFFSAKHRTTVAHFLNNEVPASQETRYCEDVANSFTYPLSVLHSFRWVGSFDEGYNYFRNCVLQEIFAQNALSV